MSQRILQIVHFTAGERFTYKQMHTFRKNTFARFHHLHEHKIFHFLGNCHILQMKITYRRTIRLHQLFGNDHRNNIQCLFHGGDLGGGGNIPPEKNVHQPPTRLCVYI